MSNWNILDRWSPYALAALRIVAALIFILHGTQKLFGFPAPPRPERRRSSPCSESEA